MKYFKLVIIAFLFLINTETLGQDRSIYIELLGQSGAYSLSYEKVFGEGKTNRNFYRVGFGYLPVWNDISVPLEVGTFFSKQGYHHLDISTSLLLASEWKEQETVNGKDEYSGKSLSIFWMNRIGYRYQKPNGKFMLRAGFTPFIVRMNTTKKDNFFGFQPYGGLSIGYILNKNDD